jgi:hypothetical protein
LHQGDCYKIKRLCPFFYSFSAFLKSHDLFFKPFDIIGINI